MATAFKIRPPKKYASQSNAAEFQPPSNEWLEGTWYVTHTSLPLWKNCRNVNITYTRLPKDDQGVERIDDLVTYQPKNSDKIKTVHGVDAPKDQASAWEWRGKGLLMIASSNWELLGYGDLPNGHQWAVTYFAKTLFTPEGIDIYSRKKEGLPEEAIEGIQTSLRCIPAKEVDSLVGRLYQVTMD
jgi:hypothetical protein